MHESPNHWFPRLTATSPVATRNVRFTSKPAGPFAQQRSFAAGAVNPKAASHLAHPPRTPPSTPITDPVTNRSTKQRATSRVRPARRP